MDSKFQSSFIPRTSAAGPAFKDEKKSVFGVLSVIVFIISLLGTGGVFAYKFMLEKAITGLEQEIALAEKVADKARIEELANFDKRLRSVEDILNRHVAVSLYLKLLGENTLKNLSFSDFKFSSSGKDSPVKATFTGFAPSYAAIAQEEAILISNPNTISATFKNFNLSKAGGVSFSLDAEFKNNILNWSQSLVSVPQTSTSTEADPNQSSI